MFLFVCIKKKMYNYNYILTATGFPRTVQIVEFLCKIEVELSSQKSKSRVLCLIGFFTNIILVFPSIIYTAVNLHVL